MLKEYLKAKQNQNEPFRRIFSDDYFDLYVWYGESREIIGMQLCYDYLDDGRALSFLDGKYSHYGIDAGDDSPLKNLSPLFVADGEFAKPSVLARFRAESAELPQPVREYVIDRIQAFPGEAWLRDEAVSGQRRSDP